VTRVHRIKNRAAKAQKEENMFKRFKEAVAMDRYQWLPDELDLLEFVRHV